MCRILSEYFTGIVIVLCIVHYSPYLSLNAYAVSQNSSEEIKNIFDIPDDVDSVVKGSPDIGNYAEGGLITDNFTQFTSRTSTKNLTATRLNSVYNISIHSNVSNKQNASLYNNTNQNKSYNSTELSTVKTLLPTKLTDIGSNLFFGVPEVNYINGTSSIKPRKGAHYTKIVPRKGVENESETNNYFIESESCFQFSDNECYDARDMQNVKCSCCKVANALGKLIKQQIPVSCNNCKQVNIFQSTEKQNCKNLCCNTTAHDIIAKQKPTITKVPYDVEVVTELLSKSQQKIFIPVLVSLFLLPLFGILIFFFWRRTKEYLNKRYYKRMDFLIDGIYND